MASLLNSSIEYIKGVGTARADLLKTELGIFSFIQLLQHYPIRYVDKTKFHRIADLQTPPDQAVQLRGILRRIDSHGEGRKRRLVGVFRDETGLLELVWFKGLHWVQKNLELGKEYIVFGKISAFNNRLSIVHPEIEPLNAQKKERASSLEPVYSSTDKLRGRRLDSKGLMRIQQNLFRKIHPQRSQIRETLPAYLLEKYHFPERYPAFLFIHFPRNQKQLQIARNRFKFEELFFMQLRLLRSKKKRQLGIQGFRFPEIGAYFNQFYKNNLAFELTGAQKRVLKEIRANMGTGQQMNRLLQGDVGSGKTIVAFMCMLMALDNSFQAALMAPTEILAQQHLESLGEMAEGLDLRIELLTGSVKGKKREAILEELKEGHIHILVGTHALIEDTVQFKRLGLVVIDEQHRFGVAQRARLWTKSELPPHVLVMTATPIPRTLAMTVYGDLDVSVIDEMPPGRLPVTTLHRYETHRLRVFGLIREQIEKGHQAYIVYPLIEESEYEGLEDVNNLFEGFEAISRDFPAPTYQISIVHGRQKPEDKDFEMQRFVKGETQIMVATTVIEVGVNVPNATVMLIENAERFGLAQLHQLRGRVGRGGGESYCILMTGYKLSKGGKQRMQAMTSSTDGFKISEFDLQLRGPGNIEGTQQSGLLALKLTDLAQDGAILREARKVAQEIIDDDPKLEKPIHDCLREELQRQHKKYGWGRIS